MNKRILYTAIGISNYYGSLEFWEHNNKYYWGIHGYKGPYEEEITKELFDELIKHNNIYKEILN